MNKEQLLSLIEDMEKELKNELENTKINKRTRIINIAYLLGKRCAYLEILETIDFNEFCKRKDSALCYQASRETEKIYSI